MTTNGVELERYLPRLLENGLDAVNVSLDTLDPQIFQQITGKDKLYQVLAGIRHAVEAGLFVKLNVALQKNVNEKEWLEVAELTKILPVDVRYIEMMPIGYGKKYEPVDHRELLGRFKKIYPDLQRDESIHGNGPAVYYRIPKAKGSIGFISAIHGKFCQSCNRLRLTSQGKLKPCLCYGEEVDLMEILRGSEGVIRKWRLQECGTVELKNLSWENETAIRKELLRQRIFQAVSKKPQEHHFERVEEITEAKQMVQIGG